MELKIGDKVRLNLNCTIGEILENNAHGCLNNTMSFIENFAYESTENKICTENKIYTVEKLIEKDVKIDGKILNCNIFELTERPKKKMTVSQICTELGYEVEIVKD